jgi:hypothetical protein
MQKVPSRIFSRRWTEKQIRASNREREGRHTWAIDQGLATFAKPVVNPTIGQRIVYGNAAHRRVAVVVNGITYIEGVVWARDSAGHLLSFPQGYPLKVCA